MSTPRRRPWTCGFWPTPPKTVRVVRPYAAARGVERLLDLADQLPGRREHEGARTARTTRTVRGSQSGDQREEEGVGLAGAGAAAAEHVTAGERVGQRRGLDRGGDGDAARLEDGSEVGGHAEIGERRKTREITLSGGVSPSVSLTALVVTRAGLMARGKT